MAVKKIIDKKGHELYIESIKVTLELIFFNNLLFSVL